MRATAALLLSLGCAAFAQDAGTTRDALEWTVALRGRMAQMANPVVRVYGIASIARVVCPLDPVTASGLYQDPITSLSNVPRSASRDPPSTLLSRLSAVVPELAADLFQRSLDFVLSAPIPSPDSLQDLAKFLLTASDLVNQADEDQPNKNFQVNGATVEDLSAPRVSANPDNIEALIEFTLKLLALPNAADRNPAVAYALVYQLVPRAPDLMPARVADMQAPLAPLASAFPAISTPVQSALGAAQTPDPDSGDPAVRNFWLTGQIQAAIAAGQFDRARQLLPRLDDLPARGQINALLAFH